MARRMLTAMLASVAALAGVAQTPFPAAAQETLPGAVATGRYGEGTLATASAIIDTMIKTFSASMSGGTAWQVTQYLQTHYTPEPRR